MISELYELKDIIKVKNDTYKKKTTRRVEAFRIKSVGFVQVSLDCEQKLEVPVQDYRFLSDVM